MTNLMTTRRAFLRASGAIALAAGVAGSLSACGGDNPNKQGASGPAGEPDPEGTITAGISYELGTNGYDPMSTSAALTVAANWHTLEGLTEIMPSGDREVYAALAADLPKRVDDTTYEVTLREGAKFHDGTDVTPEDVVFSFERVLDPENASLYASFIPFVDSVTAEGDKIVFKLKSAFSLVAERLAVVKIVPKAAVEADPEGFDANPVGTGPWKMTDNGAASKAIQFERNDDYTGPRPARAAKMTWQILPDASTRTNALTSGKVQAIDSVPYLSVDQVKGQASVESAPGFSVLFAMFNNGSDPFKNVKNRQGVLKAFQIDKVIETALLGNAKPASCFVHEEHPAYKKAATVYGNDVEGAKKLFKETGLKSVRMIVTDHDWVKGITPILKESLEAAGLTVEFTERKSADLYNTIDGKPGAYDLAIAPGDPSVFGLDADLLMRWWYSSDTWVDSRMHWKGTDGYKKVQKLLDKAATQEAEEQLATWHEVFDVLAEEVPLYPLLHRSTPTGWDDSTLVDFEPISVTGLSFVDVGTTA